MFICKGKNNQIALEGIMKHSCHAAHCGKETAPSMFMCKTHWEMLPKNMQDDIWNAYRDGQEIDKLPSREYARVAVSAVFYLAKKEGHAK